MAEEETKPSRACFSYAAYAKSVIDHLRISCKFHVSEGLSDSEFSHIESLLGFFFPPDLRSILREGLPVGPGFPDWRSSSLKQLKILVDLPFFALSREVSKGRLWCQSWGPRPECAEEALAVARDAFESAPKLVPIYRHCYVASEPRLAGNPVFFIRGGDVRCAGFDLADFFQRGVIEIGDSSAIEAPAWAATSAREIVFWSDLMNCSDRDRWRDGGGTRGALEGCLEEGEWRLREGGWTEGEVREMLRMDGSDEEGVSDRTAVVLKDQGSVRLHLRLMSLAMLRAGWRREDVAYAMGFHGPSRPSEPLRQVTWQADWTRDDISVEL
ncbi:hypothetical protein QJS04_geneDACA022121 [Acorus gramineus]|uniref:Uncharacterized protein n=1 Tax=Acorus gramineus TaxID=55184 RepID=A0AAV9AZH8_ACOGR|nr:hypothetical protein QJS04_geneDACA022121 [Acorus gramineus]